MAATFFAAMRLDPAAPWRVSDVERSLGARLAPGRVVDVHGPDVVVRAFLTADRVLVGVEAWHNDPKVLARRHARLRPHSSPVSLEPRIARAVVNLGRLRPGQTVYDPMCGTGGLLLEAADMGLRAVGSDVDFAVGDRVTVLAAGGRDPLVVTVVGLARDVQLSVTPTLFTDLGTAEAAGIYSRVRDLMTARKGALMAAAAELKSKETLEGERLRELLAGEPVEVPA